MTVNSRPLFPLIRHLSAWVTPLLIRLPVTANQVSVFSLLAGLAACWMLLDGRQPGQITGAGLLFLAYVLDNCDGETARHKNQVSEFGHHLDTFVDWLVHTAFFAALGFGWSVRTGADIWLWLGGLAALGGTINYLLVLVLAARDRRRDGEGNAASPEEPQHPETWYQWIVFALRELSRADFCFIVLFLAAFDWLWLLLPLGAIGAQAYWMAQFIRGARNYHA